MMTFSEFVKNDALEKTVVSNCDNYRQKFIKIIEKAGVSNSDIQVDEALKKLSQSFLGIGQDSFFHFIGQFIERKGSLVGEPYLFI